MDKNREPAISNNNEVKSSKKPAKQWTADVKDLPGSAYFLQTDPRKYDFHEYMDFVDARSTDRQRLSSVWRTTILPRLTTSQFQVLRNEGKRLEKEWSTEKVVDDLYWSRLKDKELENERQRKSMSTLKAQAYERFDAMQDLIVLETKAVTETEARRITLGSTSTSDSTTSGQEVHRRSARRNADHAPASPSSEPARTPATRQQSPDQPSPEAWELLMRAAVLKVRGVMADCMPRVSSVGFTEYEEIAHSIAEEILASNKVLGPTDDDAKKLMTVMSGVIDLRSWTLESDQPSLLAPDLRTPVPGLRDLCKELRVDALLGSRMLALKTAKRISRLADEIIAGGEVSPLYLFLELVSMLSKKIYQGQEPSSEQDIVQMWKDTLVTLSDGGLRFKTGEKICSATQAAQKELQERFNVVGETDRGRRVDLLLYSGELELLNSEAKFDASGAVCERQYDKNLRINRAIWNGARRHGLPLPTMHPLDIRGSTAMICTLFSPDNQILLAGAASEALLELPQDERSLRQFLTVPENDREAFMPELLINYTVIPQMILPRKRYGLFTAFVVPVGLCCLLLSFAFIFRQCWSNT
ncbi:unnamed protein product [Mortierella alpina]